MTEKCCVLTPCPLTNVVGVDRLLTPCLLTPLSDIGNVGCCPHYPCKVSFFQITLQLVEPRGGATLACIQKAFAQLAVAVRWPGHQVSLAVWRSHSIAYDSMFVIGDWVSCHIGALLLIFLTASIMFGLWSIVKLHYCSDHVSSLFSWTERRRDLRSFPPSLLRQPIVYVWQSHKQSKIISTIMIYRKKMIPKIQNQLINVSYWLFLLDKQSASWNFLCLVFFWLTWLKRIFPVNRILPWKGKEKKQ